MDPRFFRSYPDRTNHRLYAADFAGGVTLAKSPGNVLPVEAWVPIQVDESFELRVGGEIVCRYDGFYEFAFDLGVEKISGSGISNVSVWLESYIDGNGWFPPTDGYASTGLNGIAYAGVSMGAMLREVRVPLLQIFRVKAMAEGGLVVKTRARASRLMVKRLP